MGRELYKEVTTTKLTACIRSPEDVAALVGSLIKHTLYVHQQIPCSYLEIVKQVAEASADFTNQPHRRSLRERQLLRKSKELVESLEALIVQISHAISAIDQASAMASTLPAITVALVFGSSVTSPRLIYFLRVERAESGESEQCSSRERNINNCCKRLLRATVGMADILSVSVGKTYMRILIQSQHTADLASCDFQARPGFCLGLNCHIACMNAVSAESSPTFTNVTDYLQFSCSAPIRLAQQKLQEKLKTVSPIISNGRSAQDKVETEPTELQLLADVESIGSSTVSACTSTDKTAGCNVESPLEYLVADSSQHSCKPQSESCCWFQSRLTLKGFTIT